MTPLEFLKLRNQGNCSMLLRVLREANERNKREKEKGRGRGKCH